MALSIANTVNKLFRLNEKITTAKLNQALSSITSVLSGLVSNSDLATTAVQANVSVPDAYWYAAGTLSGGVYSITLSPAMITPYAAGKEFAFKADTANSGAVNVNVNSLGSIDLLMPNGAELEAGYIPANAIVLCRCQSATVAQVLSVNGKPTLIRAGAAGGTATALTATLTPAGLTLSDLNGIVIEVVTASAATGAATFQVNALAATAIKKNTDAAIVADDWKSGQVIRLRYDGTNFQLLTPTNTVKAGILGAHRNMVVAYASASTVTVTADELIVKNSDGSAIVLSAVSETVDITVSGAGGLDTGVEANGKYFIHIIYNITSNTVNGLLSTSASSPTLPSGYTYSCLVGCVVNSGGNFIEFRQQDKRVFMTANALGPFVTGSWQSADFIARVPVQAKTIFGHVGSTAAGDNRASVSGSSTGAFGVIDIIGTAASATHGASALRSAGYFEVECQSSIVFVNTAVGTTLVVLGGYTW
jgi:hypothetical protein